MVTKRAMIGIALRHPIASVKMFMALRRSKKAEKQGMGQRRRLLPVAVLGITLGLTLIIVGAIFIPRAVGPAPNATPTPTPTPIATPTPTPAATTVYYDLGEWAETSDQRVAVLSASRAGSYSYLYGFVYQTIVAQPGTVFITIEASVIYVGDATLAVSPADFSLTDSEGHEYRWYSHTSPEAFPQTQLQLGKITASGKIPFLVPDIAEDLEVSYLLDGTSPTLVVWELEW